VRSSTRRDPKVPPRTLSLSSTPQSFAPPFVSLSLSHSNDYLKCSLLFFCSCPPPYNSAAFSLSLPPSSAIIIASIASPSRLPVGLLLSHFRSRLTPHTTKEHELASQPLFITVHNTALELEVSELAVVPC
jgi:hypothetical protein